MEFFRNLGKLFRPKRKRKGGSRPGMRKGTPKIESAGEKRTLGPRPSHVPRAKVSKEIEAAEHPAHGIIPRLLSIGFTLLLIGLVGLAYVAIGLPDVSTLNQIKKTPSITVRAENDEVIGTYGDIYGDYLSYDELPKTLINAVLATEDRNFFHHVGIDPWGVLRAMVANVRAGRVTQGGSTITQQVAKNVFLTPERTLKRKLQEMLLAFWLESKYSKKEIITIYLNRVYLGAGNFGVDAASKRYFGKSARNLTLNESAILSGLLKAPSRYAPTSNPKLAEQRASQVLLNMVDAGMLPEAEAKAASKKFDKAMYKQVSGQGSLYFTDWIVDQLPEFVGDVSKDMVVYTTLDPKLQHIAEEAITSELDEKGAAANVNQAALLSLTPEGAIKAMVGGANYSESQFNRATQAKRQPGSAFKLFVYLAALEAGFTPDTMVEDRPVTLGKWSPKNYSGRYEGPMTLRHALAHSINTVAAQLIERVGVRSVINMAQRLGITSHLSHDATLSLGTGEVSLIELTTAYAHLSSEGRMVVPYGIRTIKDKEGMVLYDNQNTTSGQVISPGVVAMMNNMLMAVITEGTGRGAAIGRPAAGKTGTTSDYKDAWFEGYTPQLTTGVWAGNDSAKPMNKVTGGNIPARIWGKYMAAALASQPVVSLPTSTGGFLDNVLPWGQNNDAPQLQPQQRQEAPRDVQLSPGFWDKLFDNGDVKYDYPDSRRH